jgi:predicted TIM-barrel fold metal-dependent hydrolase
MGSDYPHGEGLADPTDFADLLTNLTTTQQHHILHHNALPLVGRN